MRPTGEFHTAAQKNQRVRTRVERTRESTRRPLTVWFPAVRSGSGAQVFVMRLASALNSAGHRAIVQWLPHSIEVAPSLLKFLPVPAGVDIVHANSWNGYAVQRRGIPLVVTEHHDVMDPAYFEYKSLLQDVYHRFAVDRWMKKSFYCADAVTAVSQHTASTLRCQRDIDARVISNWVPTERFAPELGALPHDPSAPFKLFFVGNFSRRKGGDLLPRLADALGEGFQIRCTAGMRSSPNFTANDRIHFLGRLSESDLIREYQGCNAALVPSRYEGFGYAALEAMACGKPVIGFRCAALAEVVGEEGLPLLAEIDDLTALVEICRQLAEDRRAANCAGAAGRQRAMDLYSEARAVASYLSLYDELLAESTHGEP
jgi:starch synthase